MMTYKTLLQQGFQILNKAGIESAKLDARILLIEALDISIERLIGYPETEISSDQASKYLAFIERRKNSEPISQILGKKEFYGFEFIVNQHTLTPRPDSETIIEASLELYRDKSQALRIIDFGTGTGCLLLTLLKLFPRATGVAVDLSPDALNVAKENAAHLGVDDRVEFMLNRWGENITGEFDLIISNPPYIASSEIETLDKDVAIYEPKLALDGGNSGLDCYRELAPYLAKLISQNGHIILEFGINQEQDISQILLQHHMQTISFKKDLSGIIRCLVAKKT